MGSRGNYSSQRVCRKSELADQWCHTCLGASGLFACDTGHPGLNSIHMPTSHVMQAFGSGRSPATLNTRHVHERWHQTLFGSCCTQSGLLKNMQAGLHFTRSHKSEVIQSNEQLLLIA